MIDDAERILKTLYEVFSSTGYRTLTLPSSIEAVEAPQSFPRHLVFLDLMMVGCTARSFGLKSRLIQAFRPQTPASHRVMQASLAMQLASG